MGSWFIQCGGGVSIVLPQAILAQSVFRPASGADSKIVGSNFSHDSTQASL